MMSAPNRLNPGNCLSQEANSEASRVRTPMNSMSTVAMRFHHFVQNSLMMSIEAQAFTSVKSLQPIHIIDFVDT